MRVAPSRMGLEPLQEEAGELAPSPFSLPYDDTRRWIDPSAEVSGGTPDAGASPGRPGHTLVLLGPPLLPHGQGHPYGEALPFSFPFWCCPWTSLFITPERMLLTLPPPHVCICAG